MFSILDMKTFMCNFVNGMQILGSYDYLVGISRSIDTTQDMSVTWHQQKKLQILKIIGHNLVRIQHKKMILS